MFSRFVLKILISWIALLQIVLGTACYADDLALGKSMLIDALATRERLVSGVCQIRGTIDRHITSKSKAVDLKCVFDFSVSSYRFDWESGFFVRSNEHCFFSRSLSKGERQGVVLRHSTAELPSPYAYAFDIRGLGLGSSVDVLHSWDWNFDELKAAYLNGRVLSVENESNLAVVCFYPKVKAGSHFLPETRLWLDLNRGSVPVKYEVAHPKHPNEFISRTQVEYSELNGIWVPVSVSKQSGAFHPTNNVKLDLDWKEVNSSIDKSKWDPAKFVSEGQSAILYETPLPSSDPVEIARLGDIPKVAQSIETVPQPVSFSRILLFTGAALTVISLFITVFRRKSLN